MDGRIDGQRTVEAMKKGGSMRRDAGKFFCHRPGSTRSGGKAVVAMNGASAMAVVMDFDRTESASDGGWWRR